MDTNGLKRFAAEARTILIQGVRNRVEGLGFDLESGQPAALPQLKGGGAVFMDETQSEAFYDRWMSLYNHIRNRGVKDVVEEAAYTWFNRLVAIRIMSQLHFITPVLKYESNEIHIPVIVSEARHGRLPEMQEKLRDELWELLMDDAKTNEQFAILIVAFCRSCPVIHQCFGAISDYTELLLPQDILREGSFVDRLNHTDFIKEEDYQSPELIGWLYQFYISERKDEVFAKKGKYESDEIAPATQIFTPNWIVKYMVQNTVGRMYLDNHPYEKEVAKNWKYLVDIPQRDDKDSYHFTDLEELRLGDLACGSGHILNEMFDILFQLYTNEGYGRRQAIENIFRKNLIGIDLDTRARQLATFSLLMNACQKDKSFLDARVMPRVYDMPRPFCEEFASEYDPERQDEKAFIKEQINPLVPSQDQEVCDELSDAIIVMDHADTLGSIMQFELSERTRNILQAQLQETEAQHYLTDRARKILPYVRIILALTEKYSALVMNPPYMGSGNMNATLSDYVKKHYKEGKADLFSVFMLLAVRRLAPNGKYGMINMQSWMFLSSFENLRKQLLEHEQIDSLLHLGPRTFDELSGEVVQNVAFVISLHSPKYMGTYYRLVDGKNCADKENRFLTKQQEYANVDQQKFEQIPGSPIGYWVSEKFFSGFAGNLALSAVAKPCVGLQTADNARFLRYWSEVSIRRIGFGCKSSEEALSSRRKWFPYNKGGGQRRWYGNQEFIVNWENDGQEIKAYKSAVIRNPETYFLVSLSWGLISSIGATFRYYPNGFIYDVGGMSICQADIVLLGFLNTKVCKIFLNIINPTLNYQVGDVARVPLSSFNKDYILPIVENCVSISRQDWDAHETSWDFNENELIRIGKEKGTHLLEDCYEAYVEEWTDKFMQLHANEEELNRQFIDIYGLQDELTPDVPLDEITILQQGEISIEENHLVWHPDVVMKQLISYIVGVWMGRYRLDRSGLYIAYPNPSAEDLAPYTYHGQTVNIDDDAIIPLLPRDSPFEDNLVNRIVDFVRIVFGADMLTENLNFIERQLGMSIEQYVLKNFWKDHKKMYHNRPIYWLFSSRKGAFQCLVYMHRMDAYTAERVRSKYLLPYMDWLLNRLHELEENAANLSTVERREMDRITRQIAECREYHDRLHVVADRQEGFDLDDGVVVNYAKFGDVLAKLK
ncbi:BREX-1 system adenine-specific DNA-methyltransferase PglX [Prevotella cerevisiae]|uniref:site-specific DNA-methyltransferase (adenine-specific) n=1 Tax=Segatella cerevisiae TaxID=2053716 RepID=A0ABT1BXK3_9BACT|nr:BREX-1 system adenine-specific DNA-methyltransferase PglX [Segatella cerevisiae]MCO6025570.1 BREX-1 system adenine-specific DNA-methyltransferase PglX [Segatella cerevisiae]